MSKGFFLWRYSNADWHYQIHTLGGQIVSTHRTLYDTLCALKRWEKGRISAILIEAVADGRRAFERQVRLNAIRRLKAKRENTP